MADEIRQELGFDASQTFTVLEQLNAAFNKFGAALENIAARMDAFNQAGAKVDDAVQKTNAATREAARIFERTRTPLERYENTIAKLNGLLQQGAISQETHSRAMKQAGEALSGAQKTAELAREGARIFEQTRTPQEKYANTTARLNTLLQQGAINQDTHTRALKQAQEALDGTGKKVETFTISWQTLCRVVMTQFIVRAMSMARDAFNEAYSSAIEFSKQIGEIRAINPERSFGEIAADIRQISDAFNQPLSTVAEAQYQTISDQFVTAADRVNILTAANMLAKTGADDLVASAQLLTGALNAYGESSELAGLRAAQFFESVNLGRFRMSELGTAMGRVQAIAHEVGLSMEELQASLITITIGGVKSNEAATQLRGVMTGMLKPSEGLKKAFREIGVESGEAAIATWGFQGTLQQLWQYTGGSATRMAQLFRNVRGLAGVLRIAGSGAEKYNEAIERLNISQANLNEKFQEFISTDAERLTKELNKIKNFFTAEFGADILAAFAKISGGADGLISITRTLTDDLPGLTAAIAAVAAIMLVTGKNAKFAALQIGTFRGALSTVALLELGHVLGKQIGEGFSKWAAGSYEAQRNTMQKLLDLQKQETATAVLQQEKRNSELLQGLRQYLVEANKSYLQDAQNLQNALKIEERVNKLAFNRIMQSRRRMTQELFSISEEAARKAAEDIPQAIADIEQKISDRRFVELEISGRSLESQFNAYVNRFERTARLAADLQGTAKSADQEKEAEKAWSRAEALQEQAKQIARQTGDANKLREVEWMIESMDRRRIDALRQQARTQAELAREAEQRAHQAEQHNLELEELRRTIEQKLKLTVKDAGGAVSFKGSEDLQRDLNEAERLIQEFVAKTKRYGGEDFTILAGDMRAFRSLQRELERTLASADLKRIEVAPDVLADLYSQVQGRVEELRLEAPVLVAIEEVTGMDLVKDGLNAVLDDYAKRLNEVTARAIAGPQLALSLSEVTAEFDKVLGKAWKRLPATSDLMGADKLLMDLRKMRQDEDITGEEIGALLQRLKGIDYSKVFGVNKKAAIEFGEQLRTLVVSLQQMSMLQQRIKENRPLTEEEREEQRNIEKQIDKMREKYNAQNWIIDGKKWELDASEDVESSIDDQTAAVKRTVEVVGTLASKWFDVSMRISEATAKVGGMTSNEALTAASGGKAWEFLAGGGRPRGTDVIPAFLSEGERVINAESARRFASQLTAINAGIKPVFRSEGGSVTNVGDINVTVSGGGSSHQTARSIAVALKRELRRGTSTL